jgi:hypothetical protein
MRKGSENRSPDKFLINTTRVVGISGVNSFVRAMSMLINKAAIVANMAP